MACLRPTSQPVRERIEEWGGRCHGCPHVFGHVGLVRREKLLITFHEMVLEGVSSRGRPGGGAGQV